MEQCSPLSLAAPYLCPQLRTGVSLKDRPAPAGFLLALPTSAHGHRRLGAGAGPASSCFRRVCGLRGASWLFLWGLHRRLEAPTDGQALGEAMGREQVRGSRCVLEGTSSCPV